MVGLIKYGPAHAPFRRFRLQVQQPFQNLRRYFRKFPVLVTAKRTVDALPSMALRAMSHLPVFKSKLFRRIILDFVEPDSLLISSGRSEKFVIVASDMFIGRQTYINKEPYGFDKMQKLLSILGGDRPKMLLIDIGANIGTISIPAVKRGLFQNAIAIEPEPRNYSLLMTNIQLNGISDKIIAHNLALGQKNDEQVLFELAKDNLGDHRVHISSDFNLYDEANRETITIKSDTFDRVVKNIDPRETLIWIDTQGFEGHILFGATTALKLQPPICLEFWPYGMNRGKSYSVLKKTLIESGYNYFYDLNKSSLATRLTSQSLDDLYRQLGDTDRGAATDLLIVRTKE
jgi:FkbM family methyltransferase